MLCAAQMGLNIKAKPQAAMKPLANKPLDWTLFTQGRQGNRHPKALTTSRNWSTVTAIDLRTGTIRDTVIPVYSAHHVMLSEKQEKILVCAQKAPQSVVLRPDLGLEKVLDAPDGLLFSGHGALLPDGEYAMVTFVTAEGEGIARKFGQMGVYNMKTLKLESLLDSGGVSPHDISYLADGKRAIITHAGNQSYLQRNDGYTEKDVDNETANALYDSSLTLTAAQQFVAPKIVLFDTETMKPIKQVLSAEHDPVVHVTVAQPGVALTVSNGSFSSKLDDSGLHKVNNAFPDREWELNTLEYGEGIVTPQAIVHYDLETGASKKLWHKDKWRHRRSQSIAYNKVSNASYATFVFHNQLAEINADNEIIMHDTTNWLVEAPIGLCSIGDSPYLAIGGVMHNMSIVDTRDMSLVAHFNQPLYRSSHITAMATG